MNALAEIGLLTGIQAAYAATLLPSFRCLKTALAQPEQVQATMLAKMLSDNAGSAYGKEFGFDKVRDVRSFQDQIPIVDYDMLAPWVERIAKGEQQVLTTEPVRMLERTSGSTRANKLIPYTQGLLNQFSAATCAWQWDLYQHHPGLLRTRSYWSISPSFQGEKTTEGGVPIGFEDDTEYFNPLMRWALNKCLAVDGSVKQIRDMQEWKFQTALQLIRCENLGLISVWSPTFIISLLNFMQEQRQDLARSLGEGSARSRLLAATEGAVTQAEVIWPALQMLSCWNDGASAQFIATLKSHFPNVMIQGKGLLATEGVVTFPLIKHATRVDECQTLHGGIAAINSHFLEFLRLDAPEQRPLLVHELKSGEKYSPLITQAGGLYRYHLKDVVLCRGHVGATPLLEFMGKYDSVTDVCGEKLNATLVGQHLEELRQQMGVVADFAMLAPRAGTPAQYTLYIESATPDAQIEALATALEQRLCEAHHYRYARDLGQLQALRWQRVQRGWHTFQSALMARGARLGDIKPTSLDGRQPWHEIFQVCPT